MPQHAFKSSRAFGASGLVAASLALLLAGAPLLVTSSFARGPDSVADVAEGLQDAVVNISTTQTLKGTAENAPSGPGPKGSPFEEFFDDFFDDEDSEGLPRKVSSLGSGFVIDPSGLVVTNNHVIEGADEIIINFTDGTKLKVTKILGHDPKTDLALLKVEPKKPLKAVTFGDSGKMRVGDWVMAIGNPFGLGGSVTVGIISATKRDINAGPYDDFLQTDAAINRGNSGGPLFNMDGQVIGVNTAIISPTGGSIGIGFAVPSNSAVQVIDQLKQYGETRRGWLGVQVQNVTEEIAAEPGPARAEGRAGRQSVARQPRRRRRHSAERRDPHIRRPADREHAQPAARGRRHVDRQERRGRAVAQGPDLDLTVTVGRLPEGEEAEDAVKSEDAPAPEPEREDLLGLSIAPLTDELRERYKHRPVDRGRGHHRGEAQQPGGAEKREARRRDRRGDAGEGQAAAGREGAIARGEKIRPALGAAAAVRRQGRAPLRRRADDARAGASPARPQAILIAGPTASGKSAAALELAESLRGTVINANSMQVYRELAVLTARPSAADMPRAPHRLYGTVPAAEAYSVGRWLDHAAARHRRGSDARAACRSWSAAPASISRR